MGNPPLPLPPRYLAHDELDAGDVVGVLDLADVDALLLVVELLLRDQLVEEEVLQHLVGQIDAQLLKGVPRQAQVRLRVLRSRGSA